MSIYGRRQPSQGSLPNHNITILHGMPHISSKQYSTYVYYYSVVEVLVLLQYKMVIFSEWPNFQLKPRVGIYDWALAFIQGLCISSSVGKGPPPKAIHKKFFFTIIQAGRPYYIIEKNAPLHSNILTSIFAGRRRLFLLLLLLLWPEVCWVLRIFILYFMLYHYICTLYTNVMI